ncbi:uncharacterized protein LOC135205410 isoform X3 [Macrobrachium nipponense]|uniref:uncharacterized protein LOC135205410 isoform X3 n=1 Tax=Macrobrachium nipponense TaxID=159736 RepID=UPI0030C875D4
MANRQAAHAVLVERRVLLGVTVLLALGLLLWVVAISTDYWGVVDAGNGVYMEKTKRFFLYSNTGIWRSCRTVYYNNTKPPTLKEICTYNDLFPKVMPLRRTYLDYQRTVAAFSIISLLIMLMGFLFSLYTFPHTRYMYKRLAALSHVVSGVRCHRLRRVFEEEEEGQSARRSVCHRRRTHHYWTIKPDLCSETSLVRQITYHFFISD